MSDGGLSRQRLERLSDAMRDYVERGKVAGVTAIVGRRDAIHVVVDGVQDMASNAPMRRDTIFRIASMTKPVAAVAAMILVEEGMLRLDAPVDPWLPELANRQVLRTIESELDDTVPANRAITLRDLLTFRLGIGAVMAPPGTYPIQAAMAEAGLSPGPKVPQQTHDDWIAALGRLPLMHQPGERWTYHTGSDILGILIARVAGQPLESFLRERIFDPLGMKDTAFSVPEAKLDRLATCYIADRRTGEGLVVYDPGRGGLWSRPPMFQSAGGGLVSTVDDFMAFGRMLANFGRYGVGRILARPTVEAMMTDQLTAEQKAASPFFPGFWDNKGWGFGGTVVTKRDGGSAVPGTYGWNGGFGTTFSADPHEDMVAIILIQRMMTGPNDTDIGDDFMTLAYQAIDD